MALWSLATAQISNYEPVLGTRSLWIPFKTINGVPLASVLGRDTANNATTYVISCPTGQPQCAIAPNITITAATDMVRYVSSTSGATSGTVTVDCPDLQASPVTCSQTARGGGNIQKVGGTVPASEIVYKAVDVTSLQKAETTTKGGGAGPNTVTVTQTPTPSSTSSTGGVETMSSRPLPLLGAIGAGLLAVVAL